MKVAIDSERCQGHGRCVLVSTEVFDMDEYGNGHVIMENPPERLRADVEAARINCPEHAVVVAD